MFIQDPHLNFITYFTLPIETQSIDDTFLVHVLSFLDQRLWLYFPKTMVSEY